MINLSQKSGIKVFLKENGYLEFDKKVLFNSPEPRLFSAVKSFFENSNAFLKSEILYLMYRDVRDQEDDALLNEKNLRYDLTVIFPGLVGNEFYKTIGHYHPFKPGTSVSFPEVYEVIYGQMRMILQELDFKTNKLNKVYYIEAQEGDKVIIPSKENCLYGHTTINISDDFLVLANIQERNFKSDYSKYFEKNGAAYYLLKENQQLKLQKNKNYEIIPSPIFLKPKADLLKSFLNNSQSLYLSLVKNINELSLYLTFPEKCLKILSIEENYLALSLPNF